MNKLKLGVLFVIGLLAISGLVMAQGGKGNENANSILSPEQIQAESLKEEFAPDEIIVKFKEGTSDATISMINSKNKVVSSDKIIKKNPKAVENEKTKILKKHGLDRIYLLKLQKKSDVNKMVSKYNDNPDVEYAEPNYKVYVDATIPDDYYFSLLWGMHNTGQSGGTVDADIDAPEAWDTTKGSSNIVVAVIDTGVDYNHPDLAANMWTNLGEIAGDGTDNDGNGYVDDIRGWDFFSNDNNPYDQSGHGTHCSGTIAAEGDNGIGVVGVSWNTKIMPLRFLGRNGGSTTDAILAITYATENGANIMSNSWGGGGYSAALKEAISAADDAGILFVAAAGNAGTDNDLTPHYPSSYDVPNVISVAATDRYDNLAGFSCYGATSVDLGAPGVYIASTYPRNRYAYMDGTSMAAPHVSGAAALIMAQNPEISVADLKAKILDSVDPISALNGITFTGGRLNVANCLDTTPDTTPPGITDVSSSVTSTTATITWTTDELADGAVNYWTTISLDSTKSDGTMTLSHSITLTGLSSGTEYTYEVESTDAAGNTATDDNSETYYTFTTTALDTEAPVIAGGVTGDTTGTTGEPVTISATITDNVGVVSATVHYTPIDGTETTAPMTKDASDGWTADVPVALDKVGTITYYINAEDAAGNTVEDSETGTYSITVTDNDAPVAEAGPDREVLVGQEVTFDGSTSSDNIAIIGYSWDFDASDDIPVDAISVMATHKYTATGTYTVTLTVADAADNTDSDTLIVTVTDEPINAMHIVNIDMSLKTAGRNTNAIAEVTVIDAGDNPVVGATVYGTWSGLTSDSDLGITDANGQVSLSSNKVRNGAGMFTFTVESVALDGWTYDDSTNEETSDSITVP